MKVVARALPYNEYSSYAERYTEDSIRWWLDHVKGYSLPMLIGHEKRSVIGEWTDFKSIPSDGLYVYGEVKDPETIKALRDGVHSEVSIGSIVADATNRNNRREARVYKEGDEIKFHKYDVKNAFIEEVSIVDRGAFSGTWIRETT